jgi:hypothetical protein
MWIGVIYLAMNRDNIDVVKVHYEDGRDDSQDRKLVVRFAARSRCLSLTTLEINSDSSFE